LNIREFDSHTDLVSVENCFVELQDEERQIDARMPRGSDIVAAYVPTMLDRCATAEGKVFVAELDGLVVGFVTVLTRVTSDEIDGGDLEYGLVSDLIVSKNYRNNGVGRRLLETAESFARNRRVRWLRVGVLAANSVASKLYTRSGYSDLYIELEKDLTSKT